MIYVPLLTMGLISQERQNGTMRLLMSSPVTVAQVVIGKYLAVAAYLLLFVLFLLILMVLVGIVLPGADEPLVMAGILGVYLLACAYAAIGLFVSSFTSHQLVAAVSTISLLVVLGFFDTIGQRIPVLRDVAYWLSIEGRVYFFRLGLIASKDVLYFVLIATLFLAFAYFKLSAGLSTARTSVRVTRYLGAFGIVALVGYVVSLPSFTGYLDTTHTRVNTLSAGSTEEIDKLELNRGVDMTVYVNVLSGDMVDFLPETRRPWYRRVFEQHERELGRINTGLSVLLRQVDKQGALPDEPRQV